ncbi:MAG: SH3 domain-containing protein [Oscillospiraceae bacterium]|nr:SH3 domain-containing protein [Oscillospiraceae bacterium]
MAQINLPNTSLLGEGTMDLKKLRSYLVSLSSELEYALSNLDEENMTGNAGEALSAAKRAEERSAVLTNSLNLRSGKTADGGGQLSIGRITLAFGSFKAAFSSSQTTIGTATSPLNIRQSPTTSATSLGLIKQYDSFEIHSVSNGWAYITYGSLKGYSSTTYMTIKTIVSTEKTAEAKVPLTVNFSGEYTLLLTPEGKGEFWTLVKEKAASNFTASIYRDESAPLSASVGWLAIGIRK